MKYYQGSIIVSAMGKRRLKCELCGRECLSLKIREDKVRVCASCWFDDKKAEDLNISGNIKNI